MHANQLLQLSMAIALSLASSCGGAGIRDQATRGGPITIPAGDQFWVYTETSRELRDANGLVRPPEAVPVGIGHPTASGFDMDGGWGVIAYDHKIGVVQLAEAAVQWHDYSGARIEAIGVHSGAFATMSGSAVTVWNVADGKRIWETDAAAWLERESLGDLCIAIPGANRELVVVAHKPEWLMSGPRTVIAKVDTARGNWQPLANEDVSNEIHDLSVVTSDGSSIYLGGKLVGDRGRGKMTMDQCLKVLRYDMDRREVRTLVSDERLASITRVLDLVAGQELVAMILDDGVLAAYRVYDGGRASVNVLYDTEHPIPEDSRLGWVSSSRVIAIRSDGKVEVRDLP